VWISSNPPVDFAKSSRGFSQVLVRCKILSVMSHEIFFHILCFWIHIFCIFVPRKGYDTLSGGALDLLEINEALCSSCTLKPEKFQNTAGEHDGFHALAWTKASFSVLGFLRTSTLNTFDLVCLYFFIL
jgi:hypothetical protein